MSDLFDRIARNLYDRQTRPLKTLISTNGVFLNYVDDVKDKNHMTVKIDGNTVTFIPEHLVTYDMCMKLVQLNNAMICSPVVRRFYTLEMWMLLVDKYYNCSLLGLSNDILSATVDLTHESCSTFCFMRDSQQFLQIAYTLMRREQFETFLLGTRVMDTSLVPLLCEDVLGIIAGFMME